MKHTHLLGFPVTTQPACGAIQLNYFVAMGDHEVTCPKCKEIVRARLAARNFKVGQKLKVKHNNGTQMAVVVEDNPKKDYLRVHKWVVASKRWTKVVRCYRGEVLEVLNGQS